MGILYHYYTFQNMKRKNTFSWPVLYFSVQDYYSLKINFYGLIIICIIINIFSIDVQVIAIEYRFNITTSNPFQNVQLSDLK